MANGQLQTLAIGVLVVNDLKVGNLSKSIPESLKFIVEDSNGVLQGLIVYFIFHSKIKNNFTLGPMVTGEAGEIILTKKSVDQIITCNKNDYPMDYSGELSDCELLSVIVESKLELEKRVLRLNEFHPENAASLHGLVGACINNDASFCHDIKLPTYKETVSVRLT